MPTLSAIVPNYNDAKLLPRALDALLNQSRKPDEIVVVDDASTDDSVTVALGYAARYPLIRVLRSEVNGGAAAALSRGIQAVTGDYVYMGAADDRVLPGAFEAMLDALARHPDAGMCCGDMEQYHDDGTAPFRVPFLPGLGEICLAPGEFRMVLDRLRFAIIPGSSAVIRRGPLLDAGGVRPNLRWLADWFGPWVVAFRYGLCYVPRCFASVEVSSGSYSAVGMGRWGRLCPVLVDLFALFNEPQFADIRSGFRIPAVLAPFGYPGLYVLAKHPEYRGLLSLRLVRSAMAHSHGRSVIRLKRSLFPHTPRPALAVYRGLRAACRTARGRPAGTSGK